MLLLENRRAEYNTAMKHIRKKKQEAFKGFTTYDQEVMGGYSNKYMTFMNGIYL